MKRTKLNTEEIKVDLKYIIKNNFNLVEKGLNPTAVEILGDSGLGKTSIIEQIAKELGMDLVRRNLGEIDEASELVGYPQEQFLVKSKEKGIIKWVPSKLISSYSKAGYSLTGESRMGYAIPEWIEGKENPIILLLDDYTRAPLNLLQATMELVNKQSYYSWSLPKGSTVILTSNYDNGEYIVNTRDDAMKSRHGTYEIKWDVDVWAKWAERNGIDSRAINFMLSHPEIIGDNKSINPRSLTTFFNTISGIEDFEKDLLMVQRIGEAYTGIEVATMFTTFIRNRLDKLISPKQMLLMDEETVLKKIEESVGKGDKYRADIANMLTTRFINYTLFYAESNKITNKHIERIIKIATDSEFTNDLKFVIIKKLYAEDKTNFRELATNPKTMEMILK